MQLDGGRESPICCITCLGLFCHIFIVLRTHLARINSAMADSRSRAQGERRNNFESLPWMISTTLKGVFPGSLDRRVVRGFRNSCGYQLIQTLLSFHLRSFFDLTRNSHLKIIHDHKHEFMVQSYFDEPSFFFLSFEFFDLVHFLSTFIQSQ